MVVDWAPRAAPVGLLKVTVKLSSLSAIGIVDDRDRDGLGHLASGEGDGARRGRVVRSRERAAVARREVDGGGLIDAAAAQQREDRCRCALGNAHRHVRHGDRGGGIVVHNGDEHRAGDSEGAGSGILNADGERLAALDELIVHDRDGEALGALAGSEDDLARVRSTIERGLDEVQSSLRRSGAADLIRRVLHSRLRLEVAGACDGDGCGAGRFTDVDRRIVEQ